MMGPQGMDDDGFTDGDNTSRGTFGRNLKGHDSLGTNKEKDLFGSIKSLEPNDVLDKDANGRDNYNNNFLYNQKKNKSVFDEYEQRGGVLEGYEDLNSSRSKDDEDQILSQMLDS